MMPLLGHVGLCCDVPDVRRRSHCGNKLDAGNARRSRHVALCAVGNDLAIALCTQPPAPLIGCVFVKLKVSRDRIHIWFPLCGMSANADATPSKPQVLQIKLWITGGILATQFADR